MNKLIMADLPRLLRSKLLWIVMLLTVFLAASSILTIFAETDDKTMIFHIGSNNLILFISMMMPIFSGGISILLIAAEFSSGVIRNKFIMGHKRTDILLSWGIIYTITTLLTYVLYIASFFIGLLIAGADFTGIDTGNVAANLLIIMLFMIKFQMFSFLMVCIYPDAKTAVICYILNNCTMIPLSLMLVADEKSKGVEFLSRIFIFGYTNGDFTLASAPDKPWLTALLIIMLSAVYGILTVVYFKKKDLK